MGSGDRRVAVTLVAVRSCREGCIPGRCADDVGVKIEACQGRSVTVGVGTDPAGGSVGRHESTGCGKRTGTENDRIGLDSCRAGAGAVEVVKSAEPKAIMALVAHGGQIRVLGYVQEGVGGMQRGEIGISISGRRFGMTGGAAGRCGHRTGQVAVLTSRRF